MLDVFTMLGNQGRTKLGELFAELGDNFGAD
jgi:hypothetical protein